LDDLNRDFTDSVVATGRSSFRITELSCDDSAPTTIARNHGQIIIKIKITRRQTRVIARLNRAPKRHVPNQRDGVVIGNKRQSLLEWPVRGRSCAALSASLRQTAADLGA
jgi:hypothetical protein